MVSFGIMKEKVINTINRICKMFKIPDDLSEQIMDYVYECSKNIEKKINKEIIDENSGIFNNNNESHMVKFILILGNKFN